MPLRGLAGSLGLLLVGTRWTLCTLSISVFPHFSQELTETALRLGSDTQEERTQELVVPARGECKICHFHGPGAKLLFFRRRHDQLGDQVLSLIYGMAMAAKCGLNFGGTYTTYRKLESSDGLDVVASVADLFNVHPEDISVPVADLVELTDALIVHYLDTLPERVTQHPERKTFIVHQAIHGMFMKDSSVLTANSFLVALREQARPFVQRRLAKGSTLRRSSSGGPVVAIHIRRGSQPKDWFGGWASWYTPQEWLDNVVEQIRRVLPNASIHAFVAPASHKENATEFGSFSEGLDVKVHDLLPDNFLNTWAEMAAADLLVMSKSDYSEVAALLNPNCIIFNNFNNNTRLHDKNWIMASDMVTRTELGRFRADLKGCMRERLPHYKLSD